MKAVCIHCGAAKPRAMAPCVACGKAPRGAERPLAYLFSTHHLSEADLDAVAVRVKAGDRPDPPDHLLQLARSQLTASLSQLPGTSAEPGPEQRELTRDETWLLLLGNVVLTPLIGAAVWWGWRERHPRAAARALQVTVPVAVVFGAAWVVLVLFSGGG